MGSCQALGGGGECVVNAVENRLIELVIIGKLRPLRKIEAVEYDECRRYVIAKALKLARIMNLLYAARIGKDWAWLSKLSKEYDKFMGR
jgi:hypothetical protein